MQEKYSELIYKMRPVWYRSTEESDNPNNGYWGLIAEELAEIDPRLVFFGYENSDYEIIEVRPESTRIEIVKGVDKETGKEVEVEVEKIIPAELKRVLKKDAKPKPEGVQYERLTVHLVKELQKHKKRSDDFEKRLKKLEKK